MSDQHGHAMASESLNWKANMDMRDTGAGCWYTLHMGYHLHIWTAFPKILASSMFSWESPTRSTHANDTFAQEYVRWNDCEFWKLRPWFITNIASFVQSVCTFCQLTIGLFHHLRQKVFAISFSVSHLKRYRSFFKSLIIVCYSSIRLIFEPHKIEALSRRND